jgi:coproporphyrinogen III oxidase-like Fe-S oxidoreductase
MISPAFDELFRLAPPEVDVAAIRREWLALRPPYRIADRHLPLPIWARRPFTDTGEQAWQTLCRDLPALSPARPFCIYLHVPFCHQRCAFCDCYSFRLAAHIDDHVVRYLDCLDREMRLWSDLSARPVSTVHFGGGTPTFLNPPAFERLVTLIRSHFAAGPATEWALESTASTLTPARLAHLAGLGFTRLHVGVQTLQDGVRQQLGRQASARAVLGAIAAAVERGWIVSVDLIFGLPGQDLAGLLVDIRALAAAGIHGFSLYELQHSSRNRHFVQAHGLDRRDRQINYFVAQAASHLLVALGYRKTLFNHYADHRDTNLYFTFPARGEDCLALGAIADGYFGDYHYRHPEYAAYTRTVGAAGPGLQGGLRRTAWENRLQPLTVALMAGSVPPALLAPSDSPLPPDLLAAWQQSLLLAPDPATGALRLTGNGSWFLGNMLSHLSAAHPSP